MAASGPTGVPAPGAKVGEAEVMAEAGIRNILVTTEVVGPEKIGRLLGVLERAPETLVVVDNPDNVRELGQAMARAGKVLNEHESRNRTRDEGGDGAGSMSRLT